ncbi:GroEL-like apical domain-containing protein [Crassisporium funariophilum]|nr:GroEL-like apical domain-containing protein [Crassisporium funariophilum]
MDLRRGSQAAVDRVVEFLAAHTKTITTIAEIAQVATISANGDTHVSNLIAQATEKVGREGVITVKEGRSIEDEIEITEGMRFDHGFISPYFVTDVKSQKVEFEKPFILLSEKNISLLQDILPSLEAAAQARCPLVIIADDVDGEAFAACILNKLCGQLQVVAIKAPGFGDNRKSIFGDLASSPTSSRSSSSAPPPICSGTQAAVTKEDKYVDMVARGIVDPLKVVRTALVDEWRGESADDERGVCRGCAGGRQGRWGHGMDGWHGRYGKDGRL